MLNKELLSEKIEEVRHLMNQVIQEKKELRDPIVVKLSQELDELLNMYNDLLKQDK